jgi:hypothetical protein
VGDCAHFETDPFTIQLPLPHTKVPLNLHLAFDDTYDLPYIVNTDQDTAFGRTSPPKFHRNVYLLAIAKHDTVIVAEALNIFASKQSANAFVTIEVWIVKRNSKPLTDIKEQCMMFDQVRFVPMELPSIPEPVAFCVVVSLHKPECPEHLGQLMKSPL